jgi:hypothetical protein
LAWIEKQNPFETDLRWLQMENVVCRTQLSGVQEKTAFKFKSITRVLLLNLLSPPN